MVWLLARNATPVGETVDDRPRTSQRAPESSPAECA